MVLAVAAGAIKTLEQLLQCHPASGDAYLLLGDLYVKLGKALQARQLFARTLEVKDLSEALRA